MKNLRRTAAIPIGYDPGMRINWSILTLASLAGVTVSVGPDPLELHQAGVAAHLERSLAAAAALYDEAL
ncbi:MAG: hypothetical protein M3545_12680, partial [Acidobacteriota bacterium]|nr:hypothetical protein [Acidobacteriota bacterium]